MNRLDELRHRELHPDDWVLITPEERDQLVAVASAAEKLIAGVIGDEDNWLNEWCAMFDAIDAFKKGN